MCWNKLQIVCAPSWAKLDGVWFTNHLGRSELGWHKPGNRVANMRNNKQAKWTWAIPKQAPYPLLYDFFFKYFIIKFDIFYYYLISKYNRVNNFFPYLPRTAGITLSIFLIRWNYFERGTLIWCVLLLLIEYNYLVKIIPMKYMSP